MEGNPHGGAEVAPGAAGFWLTGAGVACALSSGVCFSVSTVCAQEAIGALPVTVVAGSRPVIGVVFLLAVTAVAGRQAVAGRVKLRLMGVGLFAAAQIVLLCQSVEGPLRLPSQRPSSRYQLPPCPLSSLGSHSRRRRSTGAC